MHGEACRVSGETFTLFARACEGYEMTDGRFDPWRLDGDRGHRLPPVLRPPRRPGAPRRCPPRSAWTRPAELDAEHRTVRLLDGARFDPGGIGKGLAADLVAEELGARRPRGLRQRRRRPPGGRTRSRRHRLEHRAPGPSRGRAGRADRHRRRWRRDHVTVAPDRGRRPTAPATTTSSTPRRARARRRTRSARAPIASRAWQAEVLSKVAFLDGAAGIERARDGGCHRDGGDPGRRDQGPHLVTVRGSGGRGMNHLFWYVARAGGIVSWLLLTASVVWGLWLSGRVRPFGVRPAWILDLHRFLGGLATTFVGVHVGAILLDTYTNFGLTDVLVPVRLVVAPARGGGRDRRDVRPAGRRAHLARPVPSAAHRLAPDPHGGTAAVAPRHGPLRPRRHRRGQPALDRRDGRGGLGHHVALLPADAGGACPPGPARPRPAGATARVPARRPSHIPPRVAAPRTRPPRVAALRARRDLTGSRRR